MARHPIKSRLVAYRVLVHLLYHDKLSFIAADLSDNSKLELTVGPFSRFVRISVARLKDQLRYLQASGFIQIEKEARSIFTIRLIKDPMHTYKGSSNA